MFNLSQKDVDLFTIGVAWSVVRNRTLDDNFPNTDIKNSRVMLLLLERIIQLQNENQALKRDNPNKQ